MNNNNFHNMNNIFLKTFLFFFFLISPFVSFTHRMNALIDRKSNVSKLKATDTEVISRNLE